MSVAEAGQDQKGIERRKDERVSTSIPAVFTLENNLHPCVVLNLSANGLLLRFDQQTDLPLSNDDTGKTGTVVFGIEKSQKILRGKIVRLLVNDAIRVAAISVIS